MNSSSKKIVIMAETALLMAITVLMQKTFLGTIKTPFLDVSIVTIPVAVAAIVIGPVGGVLCGATFGVCSFIDALSGASVMMSALFQVNPFGAFVTTIVPRVLEGLFVALIFKGLQKIKPLKVASYYIAALFCPLLNTLMFMTSLILFFYHAEYVQNLVTKFGATNPFNFVILLVGVQGLIEAAAGLILGGTLSYAVAKAVKRM